MFRFAQPYWLLLWLPLAWASLRVYGRRNRRGILFPPTARIPVARRTGRTVLATALPACFLIGIALAILAMARPQNVFSLVRQSADAIAIAMVVDISGSMEALDFSEKTAGGGMNIRTRLDVVKDTFEDFVQRRPNDLIGLVTFGGFASTRVPLTLDHDALRHMLRAVEIPKQTSNNPLQAEELMTAIGDGLMTAIARVKDADVASKIVVLLSDGESNTGLFTPETAAETAAKMGIKVYTIGIGQSGPTPFRTQDMFGRERIVHVEEHFDETQLKDIARITEGRYFSALDQDGLEYALKEIDSLETTRVEQDRYTRFQELFPWPLIPGLTLILLAAAGNAWATRRIV